MKVASVKKNRRITGAAKAAFSAQASLGTGFARASASTFSASAGAEYSLLDAANPLSQRRSVLSPVILSQSDLVSLLGAQHASPHSVLGMHPVTRKGVAGVVVRALVSGAETCAVVDLSDDEVKPMTRLAPQGLFEVFWGKRPEVFRYQLRVTHRGEIRQFSDSYSFLPTLGAQDLYLFNEGNEHRIYEKLGAHLRTIDGVPGVSFAVWAPAAARVSVVGNFNAWDGRYHPM
ncbi:MAG: hypothetical protein ABIO94_11790, partial [Opitutaceae bacterium]